MSLTWILIIIMIGLLFVRRYTDRSVGIWIGALSVILALIALFNTVVFLAKLAISTAVWLMVIGFVTVLVLIVTAIISIQRRRSASDES